MAGIAPCALGTELESENTDWLLLGDAETTQLPYDYSHDLGLDFHAVLRAASVFHMCPETSSVHQ